LLTCMAVYTYKAKKSMNEAVEGVIEAPSRLEAIVRLQVADFYPLRVEQKKQPAGRRRRVSRKEIIDFTRQLAILLNSGLALYPALRTLLSQSEQTALHPVIASLAEEIQNGCDLCTALSKYPRVFSQFYISLVKIGQASGALADNLSRLSQFLQDEVDFRSNIISVAAYPLLILTVGIITVFVLLRWIIPNLIDIFEEIGQALPLPTLLLVNFSQLLSEYWLHLLFLGLLFAYAARMAVCRPQIKMKLHTFIISLPYLGALVKKVELSRFARALSLLLSNATPLDAALNVVSASVSNMHLRKAIAGLEQEIKEGFALEDAMKRTGIFDAGFINVVAVAMNSGSLDRALECIAGDYDKQICRSLKNIMTLLEPLLIFMVGAVVAFIVLSMLLPIFEIDFNI